MCKQFLANCRLTNSVINHSIQSLSLVAYINTLLSTSFGNKGKTTDPLSVYGPNPLSGLGRTRSTVKLLDSPYWAKTLVSPRRFCLSYYPLFVCILVGPYGSIMDIGEYSDSSETNSGGCF